MNTHDVSAYEISLMMARMFAYYEIAQDGKILADNLKHRLFKYFGWPSKDRDYPDVLNMLDAPWKIVRDKSAEYGRVIDTNAGGIKRLVTHANTSVKGDVVMILGHDHNHELVAAVLSKSMLVENDA